MSRRKAAEKALDPVAVDARLIVGQAKRARMPQRPEVTADLLAAARIVDAEVDDPLRLSADPVIYHERDPHVIAECLVVLRAEADHNDPLHVPHGGKAEDLPGVLRFFHHHEPAGLFDLRGKLVQRFGDKKVAQRAPLILFVVVDKHADDPRVVLCQEDPRHVGDILPLLQQRRHALDRRVRDLLRLPVDHVRYRRRAEPQLLRQITDPHPPFLHSPLPFPQNPSPPFYPPSPSKSKVIRRTSQKACHPCRKLCIFLLTGAGDCCMIAGTNLVGAGRPGTADGAYRGIRAGCQTLRRSAGRKMWAVHCVFWRFRRFRRREWAGAAGRNGIWRSGD